MHKDKHLVRDLLIHEIELRGNEYEKREKAVLDALIQMPNFYLEIKWQVQSSIPMLTNLLSNIANIDNFKIWKKGANIRFDSFMKGFSGSGVQKGSDTGGNLFNIHDDLSHLRLCRLTRS